MKLKFDDYIKQIKNNSPDVQRLELYNIEGFDSRVSLNNAQIKQLIDALKVNSNITGAHNVLCYYFDTKNLQVNQAFFLIQAYIERNKLEQDKLTASPIVEKIADSFQDYFINPLSYLFNKFNIPGVILGFPFVLLFSPISLIMGIVSGSLQENAIALEIAKNNQSIAKYEESLAEWLITPNKPLRVLSQAVLSPKDELSNFLGLSRQDKINHAHFLNTIAPILQKHDFFNLSSENQFKLMLELRTNEEFYKAFTKDWRMAGKFLYKMAENKQDRWDAINNSRYGLIIRLERMRRDPNIISGARRTLSQEQQQHFVLRFIQELENRNKQQSPIEYVPPRFQEGFRTIAINKYNDTHDIVPPDLMCPIYYKLFKDPVKLVQGGHSYYFEREALLTHLKTKETNPLTNVKLQKDASGHFPELKEAPEMLEKVNAFKDQIMTSKEHGSGIHKLMGEREAMPSLSRP